MTKLAVIMGSKSNFGVAKHAVDAINSLGVGVEVRGISAYKSEMKYKIDADDAALMQELFRL